MTPSDTLTGLIRQAAEDNPLADPRELARIVAKLTPEDELLAFYEEALVDACRHLLADIRNTAFAGPTRTQARAPRSGHTNKSAKVKQRREWWDEVLAAQVHVGRGKWQPIAVCTIDDLEFAKAEREKQIVKLTGTIVHYEQLISLLKRHHKKTVGQLPRQTSWRAA
jgi:hypothetical protein